MHLCSPHQPLRELAVARLRALPGGALLPTLRQALAWLETPTLPHAAETVAALLRSCPEEARQLSCELFGAALPREAPGEGQESGAAPPSAAPGEGALRWACEYLAETGDVALQPALLALCQLPGWRRRFCPRTRAAMLLSLGAFFELGAQRLPGGLSALEVLARALEEPCEAVRSAAARVLAAWEPRSPAAAEALWARPLDGFSALARSALVDSARRRRDLPRLIEAARDPHPLPRAQAISALARLGALPRALPLDPASLREDADPAVRAAVLRCLPPALWLEALAHDVDPLVKRQAMALCVGRRRALLAAERRSAAELAAGQRDSWLRIRACELLAPRLELADDPDAQLLRKLLGDADAGVRAAAADALDAITDEDAGLRFRLSTFVTAAGQSGPFAGFTDERSTRAMANTPVAVSASGSPLSAEPRSAAPPRRLLGRTGIAVSPLGLSGAHDLPRAALQAAVRAGVNLFFWEPRYLGLTRFLRRRFAGGAEGLSRRRSTVVVAGSFEGDRFGIERDVAQALRRLGTDYIDVFLLLWVRSPERLSDEVKECLADLKRSGRVRAVGFSTHHRDLAAQAVVEETSGIGADAATGDSVCPWDVLMLRHSAAHPGAEETLLPLCSARGVAVITFSALCYGRLLRPAPGADASSSPPPTASECYRYTLGQRSVSACFSAPRTARELRENLTVLSSLQTPLGEEETRRLRAHGRLVRDEDHRFSSLLRRGHEGAPEALAAPRLLELLESGPFDADPDADADTDGTRSAGRGAFSGRSQEKRAASPLSLRLFGRGRSEKM
jgi:diketogulonate reductase-like aldo/keto reductase/HEAT repeat protein